jgi:methylamine dehydrogenase accessory protein MauD
MIETLIVSNVLLWILVVALTVVVIALARQVGLLHERVSPAGALMPANGPRVGELTKAMRLSSLQGEQLNVGGASSDGMSTLVLWISPTCPVCKSLVPTARSLANHEKLRLVFASDGESVEKHTAYVSDLDLDDYSYVVSQPLGIAYAVSKLPFAALIGADGVLKSKGLVNTREHLESLVESMRTGVESLQDYVRRVELKAERAVTEQAL